MKILAIESSGPEGSVAVLEDKSLIGSWDFSSPRGRGGGLFPALEAAFAKCGPPDTVVVGTGPGGYNGLRASAAAAWGISKVHGAQLVGVPSLFGYEAAEYFVAGDARGGQWFLARVADSRFLMEPALIFPEQAEEMLIPGTPVFTPGGPLPILGSICVPPQARLLALRSHAFGSSLPIYLKPPHITKPASSQMGRLEAVIPENSVSQSPF
jgi:tRNA threonylcarbamoyl adenosine modification protein YeaZ